MRQKSIDIPLWIQRVVSPGVERRSAPRYDAPEYDVWVSWREGRRVRQYRAQVGNISLGGIAVRLNVPPPMDAPIWVRLAQDASRVENAEATVVSSAVDSSGIYHVALAWSARRAPAAD